MVFGPGLVARLGPYLYATGAELPLVVTDEGVRLADIVDQALTSLTNSGPYSLRHPHGLYS